MTLKTIHLSLVVLTANPLIDIQNMRKIDSVWIAGRRLKRAG